MGLDAVELVMSFEETFGVEIPEDVAQTMLTPRHVIDYIYTQVGHVERDLDAECQGSNVCLTQRSFYRLRRALRRELNVDGAAVRPTTRWTDLIPLENRQQSWHQLQKSLGLAHWPELQRPRETIWLIGLAVFVVVLAVLGASAFTPAPRYGLPAAFLAAIITQSLMLRATETQLIHFSPNLTVGNTAEFLAARANSWLEYSARERWTRDEVRRVVRKIIVDQLGIKETFSDNDSFVDDLGVD